jgi:hypothetical protein
VPSKESAASGDVTGQIARWPTSSLPDTLSQMPQPLTANDLLPLVARLAPGERVRLVQLIETAPVQGASSYGVAQPGQDEFSGDEEPLAWDAEGWEEIA